MIPQSATAVSGGLSRWTVTDGVCTATLETTVEN